MPRFNVSPAAPHELLPACRLLFADGGAEARRDRLLSDPHSGVFVARSGDGKLHAAALVQVLPGAVGIAWTPRGDSRAAIDSATAAACQWLRSRGVKVCQAYATATEMAEMTPLERCGFRHTTQLVFLQREVGDWTSGDVPPGRCSPWAGAPTPEQLDLLLATHEGTRDCPELNACREPEEILASFRPATIAGCSWWNTLDVGGDRVGVLLFDVAAGDGALEVSYLGLIPSARGRGLAGTLLRFADRIASDAGYHWLTLSVDARNTPAVKLYARHGFIEYDRREVWLASWPR